jgi:hypothetical protein
LNFFRLHCFGLRRRFKKIVYCLILPSARLITNLNYASGAASSDAAGASVAGVSSTAGATSATGADSTAGATSTTGASSTTGATSATGSAF